jgi:uncharacterized protein YrrD
VRIDLGANVYSVDGEKVGTVERIVVDAATKEIDKFVVRSGFLTHHDRLVDVDMVTGADDDGLRLDLTADQVEALPDFVEDQFTVISDNDAGNLPFIIPNAMGGGAYLWGAANVGRGYEGAQDSFFNAAPASAPVVETRSNVPETDVVIGEGTDVIGADGEKLGTVGEVFFSGDGRINGFTVKGGLFSNDVRVPIDWVRETDEDRILLSISSAEAEAQAFDIEDSSL